MSESIFERWKEEKFEENHFFDVTQDLMRKRQQRSGFLSGEGNFDPLPTNPPLAEARECLESRNRVILLHSEAPSPVQKQPPAASWTSFFRKRTQEQPAHPLPENKKNKPDRP